MAKMSKINVISNGEKLETKIELEFTYTNFLSPLEVSNLINRVLKCIGNKNAEDKFNDEFRPLKNWLSDGEKAKFIVNAQRTKKGEFIVGNIIKEED